MDDSYLEFATVTSDWKTHPDGIGYICRWSPADGESVLVVGDLQRFGDFIDAQKNELRNRQQALEAKRALGEVDDETARDEFRASVQKAQDAIAKRALDQ